MNIERAEVDYNSLLPVFKNRNLTGIKGWRYLPYVVEIMALRRLKVKHRCIADWLNRVVIYEVPINNNALSSYLSIWKTSNILDQVTERDIDDACKKIARVVKGNAVLPNSWKNVEPTKPVEDLEKALEKNNELSDFA